MKRLSLLLLAVVLLAACGANPQSRTKEFAGYLPVEIGEWERNDDQTVELRSSTIASQGHVTYQYAGPDDALAYIVIEVFPSDDAAEVAAVSRERELLLTGVELEANRKPQMLTAQVGQSGRARYALLQDGPIVVEIDILAADEENPVSDEAFEPLLDAVRAVYQKVLASEEE